VADQSSAAGPASRRGKFDNVLELVKCEEALQGKDVRLIRSHIAALKWFDSNSVLTLRPMDGLRPLLRKALVRETTKGYPPSILYRFPLYGEPRDYSARHGEPTNHDFYGIWFDAAKRTVKKTEFVYHGRVRYRPDYDSFEFHDPTWLKNAYAEAESDSYLVRSNAIRRIAWDRSSRGTSFLHAKLEENIRLGTGAEARYYDHRKDGVTERWLMPSDNDVLARALAKQEAQVAVPTLLRLLDVDDAKRGMTRRNLLSYIYSIAAEPVEYVEEGKKLVYDPRPVVDE